MTVLYYNPNIYPKQEYDKRLNAQEKIINCLNQDGCDVKLIEAEYIPEDYEKLVVGLRNEPEGGSRCEACFRLRLDYTAKYAKDNGFDIFTTTMSVSPHKNYILLNQIGLEMSNKYDIEYLWANFKKNDGYLKSIRNSKKFNIYRQNYCGCKYSILK